LGSAGASSRLLVDYPEDVRSDILDMLFLPNHVASVQILKGTWLVATVTRAPEACPDTLCMLQ
jgi:hypothetical protein